MQRRPPAIHIARFSLERSAILPRRRARATRRMAVTAGQLARKRAQVDAGQLGLTANPRHLVIPPPASEFAGVAAARELLEVGDEPVDGRFSDSEVIRNLALAVMFAQQSENRGEPLVDIVVDLMRFLLGWHRKTLLFCEETQRHY